MKKKLLIFSSIFLILFAFQNKLSAQCTPLNVPWSENFNSYPAGSFPPCWNRVTTFTVGTSNYPLINDNGSLSHDGSYMYFYGRQFECISTPQFAAEVNTLKISFWLRINNNAGPFSIGAMSDPSDFSTYTPIYTISSATAGSWINYENISLSAAPIGCHYIVFRQDRDGTSGAYCFLDDISVTSIGNCLIVDSLSFNNTTNSQTTVSWSSPGTATEWLLSYKPVAETTWSSEVLVSTTPTYTITGLTTRTNYNVRVRSFCGVGDTSDYTNGNFWTSCAIQPIPWSENFDDYISGTFPECWTRSLSFTSGSTVYPILDNAESNSNPNSMKFNGYSTTCLATPPIPVEINTVELSFKLRREGLNSGTFTLGVMSNPTDMTTFLEVATYDQTNTSDFVSYDAISFTEIPNGYHFIAFRQNGLNTSYYYWLDDVSVQLLSSCPNINGLTVSDISGTQATVSWTPVGGTTSWLLSYKTSTSGNWSPELLVSTTPSYLLTGLSMSSLYNVRVRSYCGVGDTSGYRTINFNTECGSIIIPWGETFDSFEPSTLPICWTRAQSFTNAGATYPIISSSQSSSPFHSIFFEGHNNQCIATPSFTGEVNTFELSFKMKREGLYSGSISVGAMSDPTDMSTFIEVERFSAPTSDWFTYNGIMFLDIPAGYHYIAFRQNANINWGYWIDDVIITLTNPCSRVVNLEASNITLSGATVTWTPTGIGTSWLLSYKLYSSNNWSSEVLVNTTPSYTLDNLLSSSVYELRVRPYCSVGDTGMYRNLIFATGCTEVSEFPFIEDFDAYPMNIFPPCWSRINGYSISPTFPILVANESNSYPNSLFFTGHNECAVTPYLANEVNTLNLTMTIRKGSTTSGSFSIGTLNDPTSLSSFVEIFNYNPSTAGEWDIIEDLSLSTAPDGYHYLVFRQNIAGEGDYHIDDITLFSDPVCNAPANLNVVSITKNSVRLNWNRGIDDLSYIGQYKLETATAWSATTNEFTDTTYLFSQLVANSTYLFRVQAHCRNNLVSEWDTISATTDAEGIISFLKENVRLYPNPANNVLNIEFSGEFNRIDLVNLLGETISVIDQKHFSTLPYQRKATIDVSFYPAGVYFIRLQSKEGFVTKKFIKN